MVQASREQRKKLGTLDLVHLQMEDDSDRSSLVQSQKEGCLGCGQLEWICE